MPPPEKPSKPLFLLRRSRFCRGEAGGSEFAGGRRSCDTDPRFSLDAGRMSVDDVGFNWDEPRVSLDAYLFGAGTGIGLGRAPPPLSRLPPILSALEDSPASIVERSDGQIPVEGRRACLLVAHACIALADRFGETRRQYVYSLLTADLVHCSSPPGGPAGTGRPHASYAGLKPHLHAVGVRRASAPPSERLSTREAIERLEMAHIKIEAALELSGRWQATDASLLRWRRKLQRAADEWDAALHRWKLRELQEDGTAQHRRAGRIKARPSAATAPAAVFVQIRSGEEREEREK